MKKANSTFHSEEKIVEIVDVGEQDTYDFTVPEVGSYYANDILVHNSGVLEEHGDLVFLLHHDYFYKREDETKKNDYMLIVAKNKQTGRTFIHDCFIYPQYFKVSEQPLESEHKFYSSGKEPVF